MLAGLLTAPTLMVFGSVSTVSAEVASASSVAPFTPVVGYPAVELTAARTPITPLPTPCDVQARRLSETQQALATTTGPNSLIEAEDAALIAQVLIADCGWSPEQALQGSR